MATRATICGQSSQVRSPSRSVTLGSGPLAAACLPQRRMNRPARRFSYRFLSNRCQNSRKNERSAGSFAHFFAGRAGTPCNAEARINTGAALI